MRYLDQFLALLLAESEHLSLGGDVPYVPFEREAKRLKLIPAAVAVRDQKTRWGSCSRNGNLSFSWRLIIAPERVLGDVVVHELSHLREPSHSKRYWRILKAAFSRWQEQARWLRENGHELHSHVPSLSAEKRGGLR